MPELVPVISTLDIRDLLLTVWGNFKSLLAMFLAAAVLLRRLWSASAASPLRRLAAGGLLEDPTLPGRPFFC